MSTSYTDFKTRFKLLASKRPDLVTTTLSNIFTMRLIGNKTHGDLAEIALVEFINQFMYDFKSTHVGKDRFRAKEHEEDIEISNEISNETFLVSLKAYGNGPLQLSTDSKSQLFVFLKGQGKDIVNSTQIENIFASKKIQNFTSINVIPLIYDETQQVCNIMIFDAEKAKSDTARIIYIDKGQSWDQKTQSVIPAKGRKHPIYMFLDQNGSYICEVRYGNASANALQRGLWTNTKNAVDYFETLTNGWINYSHNLTLVKLFSLALISSEQGHKLATEILQTDIDRIHNNG